MNRRTVTNFFAAAMALFVLNGCSMGSALSLYDQLGGAGTMSKLTGNMMGSLIKNPSMAGLLSNIDMTWRHGPGNRPAVRGVRRRMFGTVFRRPDRLGRQQTEPDPATGDY